MSPVLTLRTSRLVLRPFGVADRDAVVAYRNDPVVARFQGWPLPYTVEHFRDLVEAAQPREDQGWFSRCICDESGVVGDIGLRVAYRQAELGISLAASAQGQGYASEALAEITRHAFADLGLHRLHAGIDPANAAVARLLTRAGWREEGTSRQSYWHRDSWADDTTFALLNEEWQQR